MAVKKSLMMMVTIMIMLSSAHAVVLVSADCPKSVYMYEVFTCRVILYNDSEEDAVLDYVVRFDKEHAVPMSEEGNREIILPALAKKVLEVNVWASSVGKDVFVFEYGHGTIDRIAAKALTITPSPLYIDLDSINATAGQKNVVKTEIVGKGHFVQISIKYPQSIIGTARLDVGDVDGTKPITINMSPDPYSIGTTTMSVYTRFADDKGNHTLLQKIPINVSPSYQLIGAVGIFVVLLLALAYIIHRRSNS